MASSGLLFISHTLIGTHSGVPVTKMVSLCSYLFMELHFSRTWSTTWQCRDVLCQQQANLSDESLTQADCQHMEQLTWNKHCKPQVAAFIPSYLVELHRIANNVNSIGKSPRDRGKSILQETNNNRRQPTTTIETPLTLTDCQQKNESLKSPIGFFPYNRKNSNDLTAGCA